ncbi:MAG TPA: tRNA lysidine(34) synthetase TilS [Thermoleophilaceae bacterium]|nr:tRNA lysidine(34) synthetase TilS [Thermoleophilaceae bacterium]
MADRVLDAAHDSGLVRAGEPLLVMLSGGADSVALLDVALRLDAEVSALHVNYGLREEAAADEGHCRALCSSLGVELVVERVTLPGEGNVQALARDARYGLAERHAAGDYAAAHTASDQAETVLYRLATSPGRRALLGMEPRRGRLVRPLLEVTREEVRDYCRTRSLEWREDASNSDPRFARSRARHHLLPALRSLDPRAERAIAETALALRDEADVLDAAAADALAGLGGGPAVEIAALAELPRGLARIVLRGLAEEAAGGRRPLSRAEVDAVLALGERGGTKALELGGSLTAVAEYGTLRFRRGGAEGAHAPDPVRLAVPGTARFGAWQVEAAPGSAGDVAVSAEAIGDGPLTVRGWGDGDRMRPVGLGGTKTLQDLFTDRKVPRALRRTLPVVETSGGEIVWVAGVALDERFAAPAGGPGAVGLSARHLDSSR